MNNNALAWRQKMKTTISPTEYEKVRESIGSEKEVAKMLGVDIRTVQRRETGEILITFEATRALFGLCALAHLRRLLATHGLNENNVRHELDNLVTLLEAQ